MININLVREDNQALKRLEEAETSVLKELKLSPELNIARQRILTIYEKHLKQPKKAFKYRANLEKNVKGTINIVSGLPRSGTSMMMQMLGVGGLSIFTDNIRVADDSNPKGYYEHEGVKSIARSHTFLEEAKGETIKIIAPFLKFLPSNYNYRIVFMERNIYEVVASQHKRLVRDKKRKRRDRLLYDLVKNFEKTLLETKIWIQEQSNVEALFVNYSDVTKAPFEQSMRINDFFNGILQVEQMASAVDFSLYREKIVPTDQNKVQVDVEVKSLKVTFSPNPSQVRRIPLNLFAVSRGQMSLNIYNASGKEILNIALEVEKGEQRIPLDLAGFPKGLYFAKIDLNGVSKYEKLIID